MITLIDTVGVDGPELRWYGLGRMWRVYRVDYITEEPWTDVSVPHCSRHHPGRLIGVEISLAGGPIISVAKDPTDPFVLEVVYPLVKSQ